MPKITHQGIANVCCALAIGSATSTKQHATLIAISFIDLSVRKSSPEVIMVSTARLSNCKGRSNLAVAPCAVLPVPVPGSNPRRPPRQEHRLLCDLRGVGVSSQEGREGSEVNNSHTCVCNVSV